MIPGLILKTNLWCSAYLATSSGRCGRGPTNDRSPLRTLKNCGSSSSEVLRRKRPKRVIRGSFLIFTSGESLRMSLVASSV